MFDLYLDDSTSKSSIKQSEGAGGTNDEDLDPWMYRGKTRRWISMIVCTIACAFTSGPVMAYPTLEPLLQDVGLFTSNGESKDETENLYNLAYTIACASMFFVSLPSGIMYDVIGGRATGVYGALLSAVGLFMMFIATSFPQNYGWIFFLGYPIATGSGMLNQNCMYTFMWLLPENANLISGIAMGAQALSDMLALVAVYIYDTYGIPISYFLLAVCFLNIIAALVLQNVVPSKKFYIELGRKLSMMTGQIVPIEEDSTCTKLSKAMKEACKRPVLITLIMAFSSIYFLALIIPLQSMLYYYEDLWPAPIPSSPSEIATFLVNTFAAVYGIGGFVSAVFGGALCDQTGIRYFTLAVGACAISSNVLLLIRNERTQVIAEIILTFGGNLYGIIITRYCVLYAPPELFGSLSGMIFTLLSFGMAFGYIMLMFIMNTLSITSAVVYFQVQFFLLGSASAVLALALADYWKKYPPPRMGEIAIASSSSDVEMSNSTTSNENTELLQNSNRHTAQMSTLSCFDYREYVALRMVLLVIAFLAVGTLMHSISTETSIKSGSDR